MCGVGGWRWRGGKGFVWVEGEQTFWRGRLGWRRGSWWKTAEGEIVVLMGELGVGEWGG